MSTSAVSEREYIAGVQTRLSELWKHILQFSLNSFVHKHWWTGEIYAVEQALEQADNISTSLQTIRDKVKPKIVWAKNNIKGSGYDTSTLINDDLDGLIEFIRLEPLATVEEEDETEELEESNETDDSRNQVDNSNAHAERLKKLEKLLADVRKLLESLDV